jgi:hypothetical protein
MAVSAVGYELAKNALKVDISDKLFSASVFQYPQQFVNPDKNGSPIPLPPVVEIASQAGKFLTTGDLELLRNMVPRVIPGGIALSRAMGVLPKAPEWASLALGQKTYADWGHPAPDGNIPIYKNDGTLVDLRPGPELVYRGMGVDLGKFNEPGKLDRFLTANSDQMKQYRSEYIAKLIGNDPLGAESVAREHDKRFGLPLTVTKSQIKAAQQMRNTPRSERIVQRLPIAARPMYQKFVAENPGRMNLPQEVLQSQLGAKARGPYRTTQTPQLDAATLQELQRRLSDLRPLPSQKQSFDPHESF